MLKVEYRNNTGGGYNPSLDFVKGICIVFVIITHSNWSDYQRKLFLFPFWIDMAVPVFMMISGYVYALSFKRKDLNNLERLYSFKELFIRIIRFTIPFFIAYVIEITALIITNTSIGFKYFAVLFLQGGMGPGSYYYPIMIQFVFIFPLIYQIILKKNVNGLFFCFCINFVYEVLQNAYGFNGESYRLLIFRYIFLIAFGCYLSTHKERLSFKKMFLFLCFIVGFLFILAFCYFDYQPKIINYWTRTSVIAGLYVIPFFYYSIKNDIKLKFCFLELLGKASFNIFLTQMVYYQFLANKIYNVINNLYLQVCVNVCICVVAGLIFYFFEKPITSFVINKIKNIKKQVDIEKLICYQV